jgi:hypothetical protein
MSETSKQRNMLDSDGYTEGDIRGPRVETPSHRDYGWWLTWEVADGPFWRYEQRRMTRREIVGYRLFGRVPRP